MLGFFFIQQDYLISRFAVFQVGEAEEMFQVSFGDNTKLLVLVEEDKRKRKGKS